MRALVLLLLFFAVFDYSYAATTSSRRTTSTSKRITTSHKKTTSTRRTTTTTKKSTSTTKRTTTSSRSTSKPTSTSKSTTSSKPSTSSKPASTTTTTRPSSSSTSKSSTLSSSSSSRSTTTKPTSSSLTTTTSASSSSQTPSAGSSTVNTSNKPSSITSSATPTPSTISTSSILSTSSTGSTSITNPITSSTSSTKSPTPTFTNSTTLTSTTSTSSSSTLITSSTTSSSTSSKSSSSSTLLTTSKTSTTSTTSSTPTPTRSSGKRGLSFNDATLTQPFSLSGQGSKINWSYNWASQPYYPSSQTSSNAINPMLTFIPMLWSAADDLTSIWRANVASSIAKYGADAVLAFNEPDGCCWECGNSCMTVADSVAAWKQWIQPLAGQVALGAPAVTNGEGSGVGLDYLQQFLNGCTGCTVDFVPLHWYGSVLEPNTFTGYVQRAYQKFGKPVWITEFGTQGQGGYGTEQQIQDFLKVALPWLDSQSYVIRYAYFMDRAAGLPYLMETDGKNMSSVGKLYNSY